MPPGVHGYHGNRTMEVNEKVLPSRGRVRVRYSEPMETGLVITISESDKEEA